METIKIKTGELNIVWISSSFKDWFGEPKVKPKKWKPYSVVLSEPMNDKEIFADEQDN